MPVIYKINGNIRLQGYGFVLENVNIISKLDWISYECENSKIEYNKLNLETQRNKLNNLICSKCSFEERRCLK